MVMVGNIVLGIESRLIASFEANTPVDRRKKTESIKGDGLPSGAVGDAMPITERYAIPVVRS
jgi:hypothetical protein